MEVSDARISSFYGIVFLIITAFIFYRFIGYNDSDLSAVVSNIDGNKYIVQDYNDKKEAADILAKIRKNIMILKSHLENNKDKYPEFKENINLLSERASDIRLIENIPDGKYTSYTLNKGEEIALCIRSVNTKDFHDINTIMYVVIHELAHVACPEIDHTELFKKIFIFFLKVSIELGIYEHGHYDKNPVEYCGIEITENLLK